MTYCSWCGRPADEGEHSPCAARLARTDPPRYCPDCGRRMVVQVTPSQWTACCSRHGERSSTAAT